MKRNYSTIELLRIVLLFFLLMTHWYATSSDSAPFKFIDTTIFRSISQISVTSFALITGMFVFRERSLVFRNISRLFFIIIFSVLIAIPITFTTTFSFKDNLRNILMGSRDIWYLYAILPLYIFGPLLAKKLQSLTSIKIFIIAALCFGIGSIGSFTHWVNGFYLFGVDDFGLVFSIPFLFGLGLFGFLLKRFIEQNEKYNFWLIFFIFIVVAIIYLYTSYKYNILINHGNPLILIISSSIILICCKFNWFSKKINWFVKRLYFVYEFHWYWQFVYVYLFRNFANQYLHLNLYISVFTVFVFSSIMSIIITEIQIRVWNKYVDPQMLKAIVWTKSKLIKPKVSN